MLTSNKRFALLLGGPVGGLQTMCYILNNAESVLVIDPGAESKVIVETIKQNFPNSKVDIFLTHGHYDHIGGVNQMCSMFPNANIYLNKKDFDMTVTPEMNFSRALRASTDLSKVNDRMIFVSENENIELGDEKYKIIETPGHTNGSISLYDEKGKRVFVGDTLFNMGVGVTNDEQDHATLMESIRGKLFKLPEDTIVFPGHGKSTTIGNEKEKNPFFMEKDLYELD